MKRSNRLLWVFLPAALGFCGGCGVQPPLQEQRIGELGRFEFQLPAPAMEGFVVGAPHGSAEPAAVDYARRLSERTGAGLLIAYGFGARRIAVARPLVRTSTVGPLPDDPAERGSVYREYKRLLAQAAGGSIRFYIGLRTQSATGVSRCIEGTTSGLLIEEVKALKEAFLRVQAQFAGTGAPAACLALEPVDRIRWRAAGVKHHGVLLSAERGLSLRLPHAITAGPGKAHYGVILSEWMAVVFERVIERNPKALRAEVRVMEHGRIESIPSRAGRSGVVVGAPHGSFDEYTAELVERISEQTGVGAVIARGFTPTEAGGWRINVNRPTEKTFFSSELELRSARARRVYEAYKSAVLKVSGGKLALYIDIHQYATDRKIQVATVGISRGQAAWLKHTYRKLRDAAVREHPDIAPIDLVIEPLDSVEIGAWDAKAHGILAVAPVALHFEIPGYGILFERRPREVYTQVLIELFRAITAAAPARGAFGGAWSGLSEPPLDPRL